MQTSSAGAAQSLNMRPTVVMASELQVKYVFVDWDQHPDFEAAVQVAWETNESAPTSANGSPLAMEDLAGWTIAGVQRMNGRQLRFKLQR